VDTVDVPRVRRCVITSRGATRRVAGTEQRRLRRPSRTGCLAALGLGRARERTLVRPFGILALEIDGRLAASCWTKVHELHPDRFGEIYIISVHPDFQGRNRDASW